MCHIFQLCVRVCTCERCLLTTASLIWKPICQNTVGWCTFADSGQLLSRLYQQMSTASLGWPVVLVRSRSSHMDRCTLQKLLPFIFIYGSSSINKVRLSIKLSTSLSFFLCVRVCHTQTLFIPLSLPLSLPHILFILLVSVWALTSFVNRAGVDFQTLFLPSGTNSVWFWLLKAKTICISNKNKTR